MCMVTMIGCAMQWTSDTDAEVEVVEIKIE